MRELRLKKASQFEARRLYAAEQSESDPRLKITPLKQFNEISVCLQKFQTGHQDQLQMPPSVVKEQRKEPESALSSQESQSQDTDEDDHDSFINGTNEEKKTAPAEIDEIMYWQHL